RILLYSYSIIFVILKQELMSNYTTDQQASEEISIFDNIERRPVYYSERAVYIFSFLGGAMFGSILMAMNLKNAPSKKGVTAVLVFGALYTVAQLAVMNFLPGRSTSSLGMVFSLTGALIMKHFFWQRFIGK